jgi:hypothetical protein
VPDRAPGPPAPAERRLVAFVKRFQNAATCACRATRRPRERLRRTGTT